MEWALLYNLFTPTFIQQVSAELLFCGRRCARSWRYLVNKAWSYIPVGRKSIDPIIRVAGTELQAVTNAMRGYKIRWK